MVFKPRNKFKTEKENGRKFQKSKKNYTAVKIKKSWSMNNNDKKNFRRGNILSIMATMNFNN